MARIWKNWKPQTLLVGIQEQRPILHHSICWYAQSQLTLWDPMDCNPLGSLCMEFSRQEHWSRLQFPSLGWFFFFFNTILSDPFSGGITSDPHPPCSSRALVCPKRRWKDFQWKFYVNFSRTKAGTEADLGEDPTPHTQEGPAAGMHRQSRQGCLDPTTRGPQCTTSSTAAPCLHLLRDCPQRGLWSPGVRGEPKGAGGFQRWQTSQSHRIKSLLLATGRWASQEWDKEERGKKMYVSALVAGSITTWGLTHWVLAGSFL